MAPHRGRPQDEDPHEGPDEDVRRAASHAALQLEVIIRIVSSPPVETRIPPFGVAQLARPEESRRT